MEGLLTGLGKGLSDTGQFLMRERAEEQKERRLQRYEREAEKRQAERARAAEQRSNEEWRERQNITQEQSKELQQWKWNNNPTESPWGTMGKDDRLYNTETGEFAPGQAGGRIGAAGTEVPSAVNTNLRFDYGKRLGIPELEMYRALSDGPEAADRLLMEKGSVGDYREFAENEYGVDIRTNTYLGQDSASGQRATQDQSTGFGTTSNSFGQGSANTYGAYSSPEGGGLLMSPSEGGSSTSAPAQNARENSVTGAGFSSFDARRQAQELKQRTNAPIITTADEYNALAPGDMFIVTDDSGFPVLRQKRKEN